jgi:hypothetical protein
MCVCIFSSFVLFVCSDGLILRQMSVAPSVFKVTVFRLILKGDRSETIIRHRKNKTKNKRREKHPLYTSEFYLICLQ